MPAIFWYEIHSTERAVLQHFLNLVNDKINPLFITKWLKDVPEEEGRMGYIAVQTYKHEIQNQLTQFVYRDRFMMASPFQAHGVMLQVNGRPSTLPQLPMPQTRPDLPSRAGALSYRGEEDARERRVAEDRPRRQVEQITQDVERTSLRDSRSNVPRAKHQQKRTSPEKDSTETSQKRIKLDHDASSATVPPRFKDEGGTGSQAAPDNAPASNLDHQQVQEPVQVGTHDGGSKNSSHMDRYHDSDNASDMALSPTSEHRSMPGPHNTPVGALENSKGIQQSDEEEQNNVRCSVCHSDDMIWTVDALGWRNQVFSGLLLCQDCALAPDHFREVNVLYRGPMARPFRHRHLWIVNARDPEIRELGISPREEGKARSMRVRSPSPMRLDRPFR